MKVFSFIALLGLIALVPVEAEAAAYRCEVDGRKIYQSTPCANNANSRGLVGESPEERKERLNKDRDLEYYLNKQRAKQAKDEVTSRSPDKGFDIQRFYTLTSYAARVVLKVSKPMTLKCAVLDKKGDFQTVKTFRVTPPAYEGQFLVKDYLAHSVKCWPQ